MVAAAKRKQEYSPEEILSIYDDEEIALHKLLRDDPITFARVACQFTPHSKQIEVLNSPLETLKVLLPWGRRFGKTYVVAVYIAWRLFSVQGYNSYIFAPSGDQSRVLFDYIVAIYETSPYLSQFSTCRVKGNTLHVGGDKWRSKVEHVKTGLVGDHARGRGVAEGKGLIVFDEIASFLYPEAVTAAIKPFVATGGGMVLLSSPGEVGSWMHQTYLDWREQERQGSKLHRVIECSWEHTDHILPLVVEEERRECVAKNRLWWFEREYMGRWTVTEGAFFNREDVESCHVHGELKGGKGDIYIYSLDPGLDRSPSVLLVARFNQALSRLEIIDMRSLVRSTNKHVSQNDGHEKIETYEDLIDIILEARRSRPCHTFYIDPGCEKNIGERLKNSFHMNVVDCRVGGYAAKLTALNDLQRSLGDQKIAWQDHRITKQLLEFCPPINRQTGRYEFPDKAYDIIAALTQLNRYLGDRTVSPYFCEAVARPKGELW